MVEQWLDDQVHQMQFYPDWHCREKKIQISRKVFLSSPELKLWANFYPSPLKGASFMG